MWGTESAWAWVSGAGGEETRCVVPAAWGDSAGREGESLSVFGCVGVCMCMWEAVSVWVCMQHTKPSPGSWGAGGSHLSPIPQVERHQRARLGGL